MIDAKIKCVAPWAYPPSKWRRIEVEMSKNMASASGTARRNVEVLLVNDAGACT